jgi:hypothetical protein
MLINPTRLDVVYEGRFGKPSLDFAMAPALVLKSLINAVSSRYPISSQDMTVTPGHRVSDVKLRTTLFNGRGTFEVDADRIGAHFQDAHLRTDRPVIRDCLQLALDGIAEVLKADHIVDHTIRAMIYAELLEEPRDGRKFLGSLVRETSFKNMPGITYGPAIKFDLRNEQERWLYVCEITRSYRSEQEVFLNASLSCFDGSPFPNLDARIAHLEKLMNATGAEFHLAIKDKTDGA